MHGKDFQKLQQKLEKLAVKVIWSEDEDFNPKECSGGNFDDAYWGGSRDGGVLLARDLLKEFWVLDITSPEE